MMSIGCRILLIISLGTVLSGCGPTTDYTSLPIGSAAGDGSSGRSWSFDAPGYRVLACGQAWSTARVYRVAFVTKLPADMSAIDEDLDLVEARSSGRRLEIVANSDFDVPQPMDENYDVPERDLFGLMDDAAEPDMTAIDSSSDSVALRDDDIYSTGWLSDAVSRGERSSARRALKNAPQRTGNEWSDWQSGQVIRDQFNGSSDAGDPFGFQDREL